MDCVVFVGDEIVFLVIFVICVFLFENVVGIVIIEVLVDEDVMVFLYLFGIEVVWIVCFYGIVFGVFVFEVFGCIVLFEVLFYVYVVGE